MPPLGLCKNLFIASLDEFLYEALKVSCKFHVHLGPAINMFAMNDSYNERVTENIQPSLF